MATITFDQKAYMAEWRRNNPERCREYQRRWRESHREQKREYQRQWREANPDYARQWYYANWERCRELERQRRAKKRGENMGNQYALTPTQTITAPNGTKITIYTDGDKRFVKVAALAKALGYTKLGGMNGKLGLIFKNHQFPIFQKSCGRTAEYMTHIDCVIPILQAFIRFTLVVKPKNPKFVIMQDDARMEAERLIEVFNTEVFGKPPAVTATSDSNEATTDDKTAWKVYRHKIFTAPNGTSIPVCTTNGKYCADIYALQSAMAYPGTEKDFENIYVSARLETATKYRVFFNGSVLFQGMDVCDIPKFLAGFIALAFGDNQKANATMTKEYKECKTLLNWFNTTVIPEIYGGNAPVEVPTAGAAETINGEQEDTQMQDSATNQATVPTVTVADIEDIGERTEAVMKIFGVSKVDALRAVTQLKAQEINRELQPLLELLDGQKK